jgi:hypothetical protein
VSRKGQIVISSTNGADARRQIGKEHVRFLGGALNSAPALRLFFRSIASMAAVAVAWASTDGFHVGSASDYANQTSEQVTIGAKPYDTPTLQTEAFGKKLDLLRYGVLPVLVVIENKRKKTIDLRSIEVNLVSADGQRHAPSVAPADLYSLGTPHGANATGRAQVPLPIPLPKKKNPFNSPELAERSFSAQMIPPGESASGFFYFEANSEPGDRLYLSGFRELPSGHDLLYLDFPLAKSPR